MAVNLHFSCVGHGSDVVLLHGLFGMGGNLGAVARALQDNHRVFSVDLPNHGRSDWCDSMALSDWSALLRRWMTQQGLPNAHFVGHSLGGKLSMQLALESPHLVNKLAVADIAPVAYQPSHDAIFLALKAVREARCESRAAAAHIMASTLDDDMVIQFLLMSLRRDDNGIYHWRFNLPVIEAGYGAARAGLEDKGQFTGPVQFIKGGDSNYILPQHREPILALFPQAKIKIIPGCGHWLHVQKPQLFNGIVARFLAGKIAGAEGERPKDPE